MEFTFSFYIVTFILQLTSATPSTPNFCVCFSIVNAFTWATLSLTLCFILSHFPFSHMPLGEFFDAICNAQFPYPADANQAYYTFLLIDPFCSINTTTTANQNLIIFKWIFCIDLKSNQNHFFHSHTLLNRHSSIVIEIMWTFFSSFLLVDMHNFRSFSSKRIMTFNKSVTKKHVPFVLTLTRIQLLFSLFHPICFVWLLNEMLRLAWIQFRRMYHHLSSNKCKISEFFMLHISNPFSHKDSIKENEISLPIQWLYQ